MSGETAPVPWRLVAKGHPPPAAAKALGMAWEGNDEIDDW